MDGNGAARPRFKSCVEPISSDDGLFLLSEGERAWMPDPIYASLAPMLDGAHEIEAIFDSLSTTYPADQVFAALDRLRSSGYLADDSAADARSTLAFWERMGAAPSQARSRLDSTLVATVVFGDVDVTPLTELLGRQGIKASRRVAQEGQGGDVGGDVAVVVTDDYLRPELAAWNSRSLRSTKPWLLMKPVGIETWIGPMFVPGQTACWECLAQRLRGHRRLEEHFGRRLGLDAPARPVPAHIASTRDAALAEAATEITRWIGTGGQSRLLDRVVSTSALTLERTHHDLIRRPQCPSCGAPEFSNEVVAKPLRLRRRPKVHTTDGGHRAVDHAQVLAQLERHLSPITGVVSALIPGERTAPAKPGGRCLTPTLAADHDFSDMHDSRFFLQEGLRRRSGGKGKSFEQARASALAESLERYCGVFDGTEPRISASFVELGAAAIHPNACMGYSERQYAEREAHNRRGHKAYWVPEPFREDIAIEWTPLWSLSTEQVRYLPTSFCYFGYRGGDPLLARANSNGCAAGAVIEEAVLQGLLELIERDAVALWWYNRLRRPAIDLDSVDDPYLSALISHYRSLKREVWVLDVTSDIGVPTFAAISRRIDKAEEDIIYGFGAHLDPKVALGRALTELSQSLEAVPAATGPESARTYRGGPDAVRWWRTVKSSNAAYLTPGVDAASRRLGDFADLASDDLRQDINICKKLAAKRGIEILVLDQTRPDVAFPVVRVVAPGLRHFWARFGPGRLYDVPVQQGWLSRPLSEEELNPFVVQF
jgi:ribosomal protein S12 methylthiotransferase accessory factor